MWDIPPIRLSNKAHLRLAAHLSTYLASEALVPTTLYISEPRPGHQLIEMDAVAVLPPHRMWWLPPTLLLPSLVAQNVHAKIVVKGSLEDGKVGGGLSHC